ncbi:MAG TPA: hypothetical protein VHE58_05655 [Burkholderiales bacterium]|nr:hypothetical protein [Burkholderiales bacterium]
MARAVIGQEQAIRLINIAVFAAELYLKLLAEETGLISAAAKPQDLSAALNDPALARKQTVATDLAWIPALLALVCLVSMYAIQLIRRI